MKLKQIQEAKLANDRYAILRNPD
ncbi:hypothetical protein LCGC14_1359750, partial [marine sediment metagenome]